MSIESHELAHYAIEYVEPPTDDRRWAKNCQMEVLTNNLERAIEMFRHKVGLDPVIHVVRRVGREKMILIDKLEF